MTQVEELAAFVCKTAYEDLSKAAREQLKLRILDALGCALGALDGEPLRLIRAQLAEFGGAARCTLIGSAPDAPSRCGSYHRPGKGLGLCSFLCSLEKG